MIVQSPEVHAGKEALWIVVSQDKILSVEGGNHVITTHWQQLSFVHEYADNIVEVGRYKELPCYLIDTGSEVIEASGTEYVGLRSIMMNSDPELFGVLSRAWQVALFMRTHRFCGQCGSRTHNVGWEMAVQCPNCSHRSYPRISPCIIVAIRDNERMLLAQGVHHKGGMYSTLAGFVESGESLEEAVHREVFEEVGVKVKNVEYFDSQPWPFPHSLMVGFLADYDGGEIVLEEKEIADAGWFSIDDLPMLPPKFSIAGHLIEETIERIKQSTMG